MRNWYIKIKDNPGITWFRNRFFRTEEWLNLKTYIQEVIGVTTTPVHTHVISDVTNLQTALDAKVDENAAIVGATKTKITYDSKGLVTTGADATTADIADSTNKRYVTDAQLVVITNTSGTNTGDQTSIVGLSGTKAEFDAACSDGNFMYTGDAPTAHTHPWADITGEPTTLAGYGITDAQPLDADLTSWAGVTRAANVDTFITTPSSANLRAVLTDENGTGAALFDGATSPSFAGTTAMASATFSGTITNYSGIATVNNGIGVEVAKENRTARSAAIGATTLYTTPAADGFYQICWVATITRAATTSSTLGPFQFRFTNAADNVAKTWPSANVNNVNQAITNSTSTGIISGTQTMYCKALTDIQFIMGYTSSGATTMQYSLDITVIKL